MKKNINIHLISDSTGETLSSISKAVLSQFPDVEVNEFIWSLTRSEIQINKLLDSIKLNPGIVLYTILDEEFVKKIISFCRLNNIPCISALDEIINKFSKFLDAEAISSPGRQHELDEGYFKRIEAINFTINHDDGQKIKDVEDSDVIIVGPSRTSKTPTCIYLAYRGIKSANVPYVEEIGLPKRIFEIKNKLIIGLTISPDILIQIRKNRMKQIESGKKFDYIDLDQVKNEIIQSRKIYLKNNWPIIDVSRKSVEETATSIIQMLNEQ